ncbi:Nudix family hydrolase [Zooshikella marina]|uniref:Nudix family hydrolase n=1 Tax=Zooshikella ganghwensis TaxID=202772 RepID=UPI001BAFA978|nr:Nudix family hydrolase [Zooshikella ganghwensis]MBU2707309.1 Nudix family hydrolase [Zooshikella ganghwensis]
MVSKSVHVAVAVIVNASGEVLIAKRASHQHQGDKWEFPGGKVEAGEDVTKALIRECQEELNIIVKPSRRLIVIKHDYGDKSVMLDVWYVNHLSGEPVGLEGQPIQWVAKEALWSYTFPAANKPIIRAIQLPSEYVITGDFTDQNELFSEVKRLIGEGYCLIQFRAPQLSEQNYLAIASELLVFCEAAGCQLILKGSPQSIYQLGGNGLHLTAQQLKQVSMADIEPFKQSGYLLAASCHNEEELKRAEILGVDLVTLSPVTHTPSHPDVIPLSKDECEMLTLQATMPVFWLGGMTQEQLSLAWSRGAQGIASIRAYWQ